MQAKKGTMYMRYILNVFKLILAYIKIDLDSRRCNNLVSYFLCFGFRVP